MYDVTKHWHSPKVSNLQFSVTRFFTDIPLTLVNFLNTLLTGVKFS